MSVFPKINGPCPHKARLSEIMDGDTCTLCNREVTNLDSLDASARVAFLKSRESEVCVSYIFPLRPAIAAALTAAVALGAPMAAAAQDTEVEEQVIIVGAIHDPRNAEMVADPRDEAVAEIAVVYENEEEAASENASTPRANLSQTVENK